MTTSGTVTNNIDPFLLKNFREFVSGKAVADPDGPAHNSFGASWDAGLKNDANPEAVTLRNQFETILTRDQAANDSVKSANARDFVRSLYQKDPALVRKHLATYLNTDDSNRFLNYYLDSSVTLPPPPNPMVAPNQFGIFRSALPLGGLNPAKAATEYWNSHTAMEMGVDGVLAAGVAFFAKDIATAEGFDKVKAMLYTLAAMYGFHLFHNSGNTQQSDWLQNARGARDLPHQYPTPGIPIRQ